MEEEGTEGKPSSQDGWEPSMQSSSRPEAMRVCLEQGWHRGNRDEIPQTEAAVSRGPGRHVGSGGQRRSAGGEPEDFLTKWGCF